MTRRFYPPTNSDIYHGMTLGDAYMAMHRERIRAHAKHDEGGASMERKDYDDSSWLSVLVEEVGEVAKVLCDDRHGKYQNERAMVAHLREELVQTGAMVAAWVDAIDLETWQKDPDQLTLDPEANAERIEVEAFGPGDYLGFTTEPDPRHDPIGDVVSPIAHEHDRIIDQIIDSATEQTEAEVKRGNVN